MVQGLKSLLVGFSPDQETPSAALAYGLSLARQSQAHLSAFALLPELTLTHAFVSSVAAGIVATENHRLRDAAEDIVEAARQRAIADGFSCDTKVVQEHYSLLSLSFTKQTRLHDLTLFDAEPDALSLKRGLLEDALFNGGRPLLVVPSKCEEFRGRTIIVAWDGSAKSARAVQDALPFLKSAAHVEIISVLGEKDMSRAIHGTELVPHLSRHGIQCAAHELTAPNGDAASALQSHASERGADMIVMGAFVHSRLRQLVLGGVTQGMLKRCPIPLLMSY